MFEANPTATTPNPDAALLELGQRFRDKTAWTRAEYDRAEAIAGAHQREHPDHRGSIPAAEAIYATTNAIATGHHEMLNEMRDTPATTLAGMAVKADAIMEWLDPDRTGLSDSLDDGRVAWSLARDVLAAQAREAEADRELIELATRFGEQEARYNRTLYTMPEGPAADRALKRIKIGWSNPAFAKLRRLRPTSLAGMRAMARAALLEDAELTSDRQGAGTVLLVALALALLEGETRSTRSRPRSEPAHERRDPNPRLRPSHRRGGAADARSRHRRAPARHGAGRPGGSDKQHRQRRAVRSERHRVRPAGGDADGRSS